MANRVGELERGVAGTRSENLRSIARSFKDHSERDKRIAPVGMREEALGGMWNFAAIRKEMKAEAESLAEYFKTDDPIPPDYIPRIARLSICMYLLDKMQELSEVAGKERKTSIVAMFDVARRGVQNLLSESFFSKDPERIKDDYLEAETALSICASSCSVRLLSLEEAVRTYKLKAAQMVEAELAA